MTLIRDRTNLFVSYRESYTHQPLVERTDQLLGVDEPLISGGQESIEMEEMPPKWLDLTAQLDKALDQIRREMATLQPLHKKHALPGFDDRTSSDKEIETLTVAITKALHRCQSLVKEFGFIAQQQTEPELCRMSSNIQTAMAAKLQDCSTQFRQMQSRYLKNLQQDDLGELPGIIANSQSDGYNPTIEDDVALSQSALQRGQSSTYEDEEVSRREQGISRVADTILEVAEIFRDLQTMVIDQGALVDRIDYNVEQTLSSTKNASAQLIQGEKYQKRTQKCKIILLLVLIVIALVIILVFKPRRSVVYESAPKPVPPEPSQTS